jgi:hypothetical protein
MSRGQSARKRGKATVKTEIMLHIVHDVTQNNTKWQLPAMSPAKNPGRPAAALQKLQTRLISV